MYETAKLNLFLLEVHWKCISIGRDMQDDYNWHCFELKENMVSISFSPFCLPSSSKRYFCCRERFYKMQKPTKKKVNNGLYSLGMFVSAWDRG